MIEQVGIESFLKFANKYPVLDVRSPSEYEHAQIPGAYNLPLFSNEERQEVGTIYKQNSRQEAIKIGLDFFGPKMRPIVEETEALVRKQPNEQKYVLVYCWRGGMRSAGVAWLLDLYGFKIMTLKGGYKTFRKWVLASFENHHLFNVIGGYTGSGKTRILRKLADTGHTIIDLERIAQHKGSAFGALDGHKQPTQEMFENILAGHIATAAKASQPIWLEDESQRIGLVNLPNALWNNIRKSPVYFLDIPFDERLNYITAEYQNYDKEKLVNAIIRLQKRLGGLDTKTAINHLLENNTKECFRVLLRYYDKHYNKALQNRENLQSLLLTIICEKVDENDNAKKLLAQQTV